MEDRRGRVAQAIEIAPRCDPVPRAELTARILCGGADGQAFHPGEGEAVDMAEGNTTFCLRRLRCGTAEQ